MQCRGNSEVVGRQLLVWEREKKRVFVFGPEFGMRGVVDVAPETCRCSKRRIGQWEGRCHKNIRLPLRMETVEQTIYCSVRRQYFIKEF